MNDDLLCCTSKLTSDRRSIAWSQIFRTQPGVFREACKHSWANFVAVVKRKHRVGPAIARQHFVRARFALDGPANALQRRQHAPRLRSRPFTHRPFPASLRGAEVERQQAWRGLPILQPISQRA